MRKTYFEQISVKEALKSVKAAKKAQTKPEKMPAIASDVRTVVNTVPPAPLSLKQHPAVLEEALCPGTQDAASEILVDYVRCLPVYFHDIQLEK